MPAAAPPRGRTLTGPAWRARARAHEERVDAWTAPHLARRKQGQKHPVEDFLFGYYSFRPAQLRQWHPGYGVSLADADDLATRRGYAVRDALVTVAEDTLTARRPLVRATYELLAATRDRAPHYGCFGLHEWAMVYRLPPSQVRHEAYPLRLGAAGTDDVVRAHRMACSHFDAFRFFTEEARPRNAHQPAAHDRAQFEQPACLHAGMDLYKHAFRLSPLVPSELLADCFALARDLRALDMRASPYDLSALGYAPVRIETPEGKQEYVAAQRAFVARAAPLRAALLAWCEELLDAAPPAADARREGAEVDRAGRRPHQGPR